MIEGLEGTSGHNAYLIEASLNFVNCIARILKHYSMRSPAQTARLLGNIDNFFEGQYCFFFVLLKLYGIFKMHTGLCYLSVTPNRRSTY